MFKRASSVIKKKPSKILLTNYFLKYLSALSILVCSGCAESEQPSSHDDPINFLEIEKPYTFLYDFNIRNKSNRVIVKNHSAENTLLLDNKWTILHPKSSPEFIENAIRYFKKELSERFVTNIKVSSYTNIEDSNTNYAVKIIYGNREKSACSSNLNGSKDFQIQVVEKSVIVCGFDDKGAMHGIYELVARMALRESPSLPKGLNVNRISRYPVRMTSSALGWMQWPDSYLSFLASTGIDAIFTSEYANPTGAIAPEAFQTFKQQNPEKLKKVIRRANSYGIKVYCPLLFNYNGEQDKKELKSLVNETLSLFPNIGGLVLLSEGFLFNGRLAGGNRTDSEAQEWLKGWAQAIAIVSKEVEFSGLKVNVVPWDYNIDMGLRHLQRKINIIEAYPDNVIPMLSWDVGKKIVRDGYTSYIKDYAISEIGPSEATLQQLKAASKKNAPVFLRADTASSWQLGTFPYLPFPNQWLERYRALQLVEPFGVYESWNYGLQPSFIADIRRWHSWSNPPKDSDLLTRIAIEKFGENASRHAVIAWRKFSQAIKLLPDTGPNFATNNSIGAPIFLNEPPNLSAVAYRGWYKKGGWSFLVTFPPILTP